jgi:hypothetical protein
MAGVQLFDDMGKSFARKYRILVFQDFIVSKDGKWIEFVVPSGSKRGSEKIFG